MRTFVSYTLSILKYLLALYMMLAGLLTPFGAVETDTRLGIIYESRVSLAILGFIIFVTGLTLFIAKIKKWKKVVGWGLMACYLEFLFAGILNWVALGWPFAWSNFIAAVVVGALYLRWKYSIYYVKPNKKLLSEC